MSLHVCTFWQFLFAGASCLGRGCARPSSGHARVRWRSPPTNPRGAALAPTAPSVPLAPVEPRLARPPWSPGLPGPSLPGGRVVSRWVVPVGVELWGSLLLTAALLSPHLSRGTRAVFLRELLRAASQVCWICGQRCWSRQRALLCADRQTDRPQCAACTWSTARGTWKADVGLGPAGEAPGPRFLPRLCGQGWSRELCGTQPSPVQGMSAGNACRECLLTAQCREYLQGMPAGNACSQPGAGNVCRECLQGMPAHSLVQGMPAGNACSQPGAGNVCRECLQGMPAHSPVQGMPAGNACRECLQGMPAHSPVQGIPAGNACRECLQGMPAHSPVQGMPAGNACIVAFTDAGAATGPVTQELRHSQELRCWRCFSLLPRQPGAALGYPAVGWPLWAAGCGSPSASGQPCLFFGGSTGDLGPSPRVWARPPHPFELPKERPRWVRSQLGSTNLPDFHQPRNGSSLTSPLSFAVSPRACSPALGAEQ
ncbi:uncharacterized protein LOC128797878 isoform X1 [Vidua chalybeata]|uniref:uncharacterized protein LOC128797878 isoform X1 n=1 Tax=Vidua chalybeata TaxID=81927 RepID=UPI0023A82334|nr:uncharacterized protein LOC128797878 isoform X1 [Vidua chalybeata]XP_053816769.1 uncharacterized protein LOC128797878 isoform X1 [Vidua chalybeata]XP_053816770.1 uncharacterized protein LOC128797878 isoform X1 [Vidua chalybeata]XP_053816771.1 uncharacterized protein LOC128797878 isoform X1 [Vidua chalybeata]XP_053816772.1 uncharacterized protein LOC128797878 isoform X1 [Vidua chalybeata]